MEKLVSWFLVLYAAERVFETFWKRKKVEGRIVERYTLPLLVSVHALVYILTIKSWMAGHPQLSVWVTLTGMTMVLISIAARNWAIQTLGPYHSIYIEIRETHPLVKSGPYQYVRNPYYLSNMVEIIGLPMITGSFMALFLAVFLYVPLLWVRLILEERALNNKFGCAFVSYQAQVPSVFPKKFRERTYGRRSAV